MTTNVMSDTTAVLNSTNSTPKSDDNSENALKFGDDDVSSKRRKYVGDDDGDDDEYNANFSTNCLSSSFVAPFALNGAIGAFKCSSRHSNDFIGGPVHESTTKVTANNENANDAFNVSITTLPSNSSFGFENTFAVLERQLNVNEQPILSQQQIEYILMRNNATAVKNPIYIDIPISDEWCLRTISGQTNGLSQGVKSIDPSIDDSPPSLFDLEIEAMLRVKELLGATATATDTVDAAAVGCASAIEAAERGHIPINTSLIEDSYQQDGGDYSEYVYHVAKSKDGRVYLRVVRSLLVDKGNQIHNILSVLTVSESRSSSIARKKFAREFYIFFKWATSIFIQYLHIYSSKLMFVVMASIHSGRIPPLWCHPNG